MTESYINIWGVLVIHVLARINAILAFLGPDTKCMGQRLYLHVSQKAKTINMRTSAWNQAMNVSARVPAAYKPPNTLHT